MAAGRGAPRLLLFSDLHVTEPIDCLAGAKVVQLEQLANLDLSDGADNYLRVVIELPADASAAVLNQTSDVTFAFDGSQRSATSK